MPNKLTTTVITAAALAFCGQAFAQHSTVSPIDKPPNASPDTIKPPDTPAERVQPKADAHKSHGAKKKPKYSKKTVDSEPTNIAPAGGDDAIPPTR